MSELMPSAKPETLGLVVLDGTAGTAVTGAVDVLRLANALSGRELFAWRLLSVHGGDAEVAGGLGLRTDAGIAEAGPLDALFVCDSRRRPDDHDPNFLAWLRQRARSGCVVGAIDTGGYALAQAGLLAGRGCCVHWEALAAFGERYPDIDSSDELFRVEGQFASCAGGTAAIDLMLSWVAGRHGDELARAIADALIVPRLRRGDEAQRADARERLGVCHTKLREVVGVMERTLEAPLPRDALARRARLSTRQLERLFRQQLGCSPARYYLRLRLEKARRLLAQTEMQTLEIAIACGFVSASHFAKAFRDQYGRTPREDRRAGPFADAPRRVSPVAA
mgnify:CR=1 FL=1